MELRLASFTFGLRDDTKFSNAEICVHNKIVQVHRSIVFDLSEFFNKAFSGNFQEAEERLLMIEDASSPAMSVVLNFAFCLDVHKDLHEKSFDIVCEVISLSERFQVTEMTRLAVSAACTRVTTNNCIQLFLLLNLLNCEQKNIVFLFIVLRLYIVSKTSKFNGLSLDDLDSFVSSNPLSRGRNCISSFESG